MSEADPEPGALYWKALEPIWEAISIYDGPEAFLEGFSRVRIELGHLFAIHWCQSEVSNGGFHQFFHNSTGVLAPEALEGFRAVGLPQCAALLEEAMAFFGRHYPRDRNIRISMLDAHAAQDPTPFEYYLHGWDPFRNLDGPFFDALENDHGGFARQADACARDLAR